MRVSSQRFIKTLRQKYLVFLFFVAISTLAWYIRALGDTYVTEVIYPLKYYNIPSNYSFAKTPAKNIKVHVKADGFTILSLKYRFIKRLNLNVSNLNLYSKNADSMFASASTKTLFEKLAFSVFEPYKNLELMDISPDSIFLSFTYVKKKQIPVKIRISSWKNICDIHAMLTGKPYSYPSSITITGPSTIVDSSRYIDTELITARSLTDTFSKFIALTRMDSRLGYSTDLVKVIIPVDKYFEAQMTAPISFRNVADSIDLKIFPGNVSVKYRVGRKASSYLTDTIFKPYVALDTARIKSDTKLKVNIDTPANIKIVKITPENVEYLIEKKSVENRDNRGNR